MTVGSTDGQFRGDTGAVTVSDTSLVFTTGDWGTAQSVTVTGVDDDDARVSLTVKQNVVVVTVTVGRVDRSGMEDEGKVGTVVVTVTDNDTADLVISESSLTVAEESGRFRGEFGDSTVGGGDGDGRFG